MKRLLVLGTFAVLAIASASLGADNGRADVVDTPTTLPPISIAVFAPADVPESFVDRVFAEVEAIWGPTGIAFDWHRIGSTDAVHAELGVTIDERKDGFVTHPDALGWIAFSHDGPGSCIHLSRGRAEALITSRLGDRTPFTHEVLVGRALGRALSHELGHYLLQSKAHTPRGLMRAVWPSEQIFSNDRQGFELSAEQREAAARRVDQDERTRRGL
jgi:hypothetical protein